MAGMKDTPRGASARGRTPPGTPTVKERWLTARRDKERVFDPGVACVNGHISLRWTVSGICISCKRARDNAYNAAHKEEHRARSKRSADARPDEVKQYRKAYYRAHDAVAKQRSREWAAEHPEHVRTRRLRWYAQNVVRLRKKAAADRAANPEPARRATREWKRANVHQVREADSRRRARELGAQLGDRKAYAAYVKWSREAKSVPCYWCKKATKPGQRHLDHIIPLAKGGADSVTNICVACPACNLAKNAKMPEDFAGQAELRLA